MISPSDIVRGNILILNHPDNNGAEFKIHRVDSAYRFIVLCIKTMNDTFHRINETYGSYPLENYTLKVLTLEEQINAIQV